ncbi:hypothetical protein ACTMU2_33040 [Cupriavidus basilensis]
MRETIARVVSDRERSRAVRVASGDDAAAALAARRVASALRAHRRAH